MLDACKDVREDHPRICASEMKTILVSLSTEHENPSMEGREGEEGGGREIGREGGKGTERLSVPFKEKRTS